MEQLVAQHCRPIAVSWKIADQVNVRERNIECEKHAAGVQIFFPQLVCVLFSLLFFYFLYILFCITGHFARRYAFYTNDKRKEEKIPRS